MSQAEGRPSCSDRGGGGRGGGRTSARGFFVLQRNKGSLAKREVSLWRIGAVEVAQKPAEGTGSTAVTSLSSHRTTRKKKKGTATTDRTTRSDHNTGYWKKPKSAEARSICRLGRKSEK